MQTIHINNSEAENYINDVYGDNQSNLVDDFLLFIKTELTSKELKKGLDEVEQFKKDKVELTNANDFLKDLQSEH